MKPIEVINLVFLFISLYFEVFLLILYIRHRRDIKNESLICQTIFNEMLQTSIIVPCFNEENTVDKTVQSLLSLDYPKEKLEILIIDDGSTDNTWKCIQKYNKNPQIKIFKKTNGGKHTALNFGISKAKGEIIGCLDADSFVEKGALKNMMAYFADKKTMAVTPSIKVFNPRNFLQRMQWSEYTLGILIAKLFSYADAVLVMPGPFSMFRKEVFKIVGNYKKAHHTEDMEITLRLHRKKIQIRNSHNSYVYTTAPKTIKTLYKQRLRWNFGFIKNAMDYKEMLFNKRYGNYGMLVLPFSLIIAFSVFVAVFNIGKSIFSTSHNTFLKISGLGFHLQAPTFDPFSLNTSATVFILLILLTLSFSLILIATKMSTGKIKIKREIFYFILLYGFISPIWMTSAIYKATFSRQVNWR